MKYSQYLELEKRLHEKNITMDDIKENKEILNEAIGLGFLGAIAGGALALIFRKQLLSWGIKAIYLKRMNSFAKNFEKKILEQVGEMAKKSAQYRQNLLKKDKQLRTDDSEEAAEERKALQVHKQNYERRLTKEVNNFIDKISAHKTKEIEAKIEDLPGVSEGHKLALKSYWEVKLAETRLSAFQKLTDEGVITDKDILDALKQEAADIKAEAEANLKNAKKKIETEKKEEGEEERDPAKKIENNIGEVLAEKDKMKEEDFLRKIRLILTDMKKLDDSDEQNRLFNIMKEKIGIDKIKAAQKVSAAEPEEEEAPEQTVLEPEDEL